MNRQKTNILLLLLIALVILPCLTWADGGLFPKDYSAMDISEPEQKAFIFFNPPFETLVISVTYEGNVDDFGWVIPVPSEPSISSEKSDLFVELHYLTEPIIKKPVQRMNLFAFSTGMMAEGVEVISSNQIGIYNVTTLSATDSQALSNWLKSNGYRVPEGSENVFLYYTEKGWYFVAAKINLVPFREILSSALSGTNYSSDNLNESANAI